jgi:hypothetical protein
MLTALDRAVEADVLLGTVLGHDEAGQRVLGSWVMQHRDVEMLTWPLTGETPGPLRNQAAPKAPRRGPVPPGPSLPAEHRTRLFDQLRTTAETSRRPGEFLAQRQALYLCGYDNGGRRWLAEQQRRQRDDTWLTKWLSARSIATVATRWGDPDRLRHFVDATLVDDDRGEAANLSYWAYWVGEMDPESSDDFIATGEPGTWDGSKLFDHLLRRLTPEQGSLPLYVHTMWALLTIRPGLLRPDGRAAQLVAAIADLLDSPGTTGRLRREAEEVRYAARQALA